mgnify:FL=1
MERRSHVEITAEILDAAMNGARKTHIVYRANLNHAILESYLQRLKVQGLISTENGNERKVKTTLKGLRFVEQYRTLQVLANF